MNELEEGSRFALDFGKLAAVTTSGVQVVPVVLQDKASGDVLFIGYANEEALEASLRERIAVLWSTSRNELWRKGSTSGDVLELAEVRVNCEQNALLYLVRRTTGGACHTRLPSGSARPSCFYRTIDEKKTLQQLALLPAARTLREQARKVPDQRRVAAALACPAHDGGQDTLTFGARAASGGGSCPRPGGPGISRVTAMSRR